MTRWGRWRLELFAMGYGLVAAASVVAAGRPHTVAVALLTFAALAVLALQRWLAPLSSVLSFGLLAVATDLAPRTTMLQFVGVLLVFAVTGWVNRGRDLAVAALTGLALLVYDTVVLPAGGGLPDLFLSTVIAEGLLLAGWAIAHRSHQVRALLGEADLLSEQSRLRTQALLAEQRAGIARELHDVVSHSLSVVVVQAQAAHGALLDLPVPDVEAPARHLDAVEGAARDALGEMRRMLGLLQLDDDTSTDDPGMGPDAPAPRMGDLPPLVERARAAGLMVDADLPDPHLRLGPGLELAVYRIVQESLTNVLKHGPDCPTTVSVAVEGTWLRVRVLSRGSARVSAAAGPSGVADAAGGVDRAGSDVGGHGLVGMRERVTAYGGTLLAGPDTDGDFCVDACFPVEPETGRPW